MFVKPEYPMEMYNVLDNSIDHIKVAIASNDIISAIELYTDRIQTKETGNIVNYYINRSIAYLHIEMARSSIKDCKRAIEIDKKCGIAYFIMGISYLWIEDEDNALNTWKSGIENSVNHTLYYIMISLVNNHNCRSIFFQYRFNTKNLFNAIESWDPKQIYTDGEVQMIYSELRSNFAHSAVNHFSEILAYDPKNTHAIIGRGIAYYMIGQFEKALNDLNAVSLQSSNHDHTPLLFRAFARAAMGQLSRAIIDLSQYLALCPYDFGILYERALIQKKRCLYKSAISDLQRIPEEKYTSRHWVLFGECFYEIGDLKSSLDSLKQADQNDYRTLYCCYLVYKDIGVFDRSIEKLQQAAEKSSNSYITKQLGELYLETGNAEMSSFFFEQSMMKNPNDLSTILSFSHSLFSVGRFREASELLFSFSDCFTDNVINCDTIVDPIRKMLVSTTSADTIYNGLSDCYYYYDIINHMNTSLSDISHSLNSNMYYSENQNHFIFSLPSEIPKIDQNLNAQEIRMIESADRIGQRCLSKRPEISQNPRLYRALGFCVLRLIHTFRKCKIEKTDWDFLVSLNEFIKIIKFSHVHSNIMMNAESRGSITYPVYHIISGERVSPRFSFAFRPAIKQLVKYVNSSKRGSLELDPHSISKVDDLLIAYQKDIVTTNDWKPISTIKLTSPHLELRSIGIYGHELLLRSHGDSEQWVSAIQNMKPVFNEIIEKDYPLDEISTLVTMMWVGQPLNVFNIEIGHVLILAYIIEKHKCEIVEFDSMKEEEFIYQMIEPNISRLSKNIEYHISNNQLNLLLKDESVDFWETIPSPATMSKLLTYPCDQ